MLLSLPCWAGSVERKPVACRAFEDHHGGATERFGGST